MASEQERPTIVGLDIVRFMAAVMVMCFHLCSAESLASKDSIFMKIIGGRVAFPEFYAETWFGWLGVEIFFVISGIVIVYSAEGSTAAAFFRSRVLRLYPAALVCASLTAAIILALGLATYRGLMREWLDSISLFPFAPWVDDVYWTLGVEISFYALVFVLLAFNRFQYIERVALLIGFASSAHWIIGTAFAPDFLQRHIFDRRLELSLVLYGCFFGVGVLTYLSSRDGLSATRLLAMIVFAAAAVLEVSYKTVVVNLSCDANPICTVHRSALAPQLFFIIALGAIFASMRSLACPSAGAARLIRRLGLATYPLYLVHSTIGGAAIMLALTLGGSKYAALGSAILLSLGVSVVVASVIEPPVKAWLRRLLFWVGDSLPGSSRRFARG